MMMNRRQFVFSAAASAVCAVIPDRAGATTYPTRPVRVLVGFPAGGGADVLTRLIGEWLQTRLGHPFVVENRPGAGTNLATEAVVRAPADGYTLLATTTSNLLNGSLYDNLRYDFVRDITPVAGLTMQPLVITCKPSFPAGTLPELIAYAKAHPGKLSVGNTGSGTVSHLAAELFKQATGIDFVPVAYRGSNEMLTDLIGGRIQVAFDNIPASIEQVRSGNLRALAVTTAARSAALPSLPTVGEFIPGYEAFTVAGIGAPRYTPGHVIDVLNTEINVGLADPTLKARLDQMGATTLTGSPDAFARLIDRETQRWAEVIRSAGLRVN